MRIQVGKRYKTRDGRYVDIEKESDQDLQHPFYGTLDGARLTWALNGAYYIGKYSHSLDLIEEAYQVTFPVYKSLASAVTEHLHTFVRALEQDTAQGDCIKSVTLSRSAYKRVKQEMQKQSRYAGDAPCDANSVIDMNTPYSCIRILEETVLPLQLKVGKFYKTRLGEKVELLRFLTGPFPCVGIIGNQRVDRYAITGRVSAVNEALDDIVQEWED